MRVQVECKSKTYNSRLSSQEIVRHSKRLITPCATGASAAAVKCKEETEAGRQRALRLSCAGRHTYINACRPHSLLCSLYLLLNTLTALLARASQSWADEISALLKATCKEIEMEHGSRAEKGEVSASLSLSCARKLKGTRCVRRARKVIFLAWKPSDGAEEMKISRNGNCCESSWNVYCGYV